MARTPKARALGNALRTQREQHGWTLRAFAQKLNREPGVVSRWETGDRTPRPEQVARMLTVLGVEEEVYEEVLALTNDIAASRWVATTLPEQRQQLTALLAAERQATSITDVSPLLIPGLLQTDAYIHGVMSGCGLLSESEIARRSALRIERRDVITGHEPKRYLTFIGEGALYQVVGSREAMAEQLRYLLAIGRRPNICSRVIPRDSGWNPSLEGAFMVFAPEGGSSLVHIETRSSSLFLHDADEVAPYEEALDVLLEVALSPESSAAAIGRAIGYMEG